MKKNHLLIALALLISFFIYLFFRSEETVIIKIVIFLISSENYLSIKTFIQEGMALPYIVIYSLPEGLWVFSATVLSKNIMITFKNFTFNALYIPLIFAIGLEFLQLIHLTHGSFDFSDIALSILFWTIANYLLPYPKPKHQLLKKPFSPKSSLFFFSYGMVYFSYVIPL